MQKRTFGPYVAAINRAFMSVMALVPPVVGPDVFRCPSCAAHPGE
jgi:hypothetical protein